MAKKRKLRMGTKAAFVRSNPGIAANELVTLAEKQSIPLTVGYVYNIRAADKAKQADARENGASQSKSAARRSGSGSGSLDAQLRTLIIRIGLDRAEEIFGELKSGLARVS